MYGLLLVLATAAAYASLSLGFDIGAGVAGGVVGVKNQAHKDKADDPKMICYFTSWASKRPGNASYTPEDIDPTLCTHIVYSFTSLNPETLTIRVDDPQTDIVDGYYAKVTAFKQYGIKVTVAIGGWGDSGAEPLDKYSRMITNSTYRARFISSVVDFLRTYNFDGLDLDWEYPRCWWSMPWDETCPGPASDKQNFANLVVELRAAFRPYGYLLSAAVAGSELTTAMAYDIPTLSAALDWIGIMVYDLHGPWAGTTGHQSAFSKIKAPVQDAGFNVVDIVNYWVKHGAARDKIVVGIPLYGKVFTLLNNGSDTGVGAPVDPNVGGGFDYWNFCGGEGDGAGLGWSKVHVPDVGPYAYKGDQWTSFDDPQILVQKAEYIRAEGLGGAMIWALDTDDFNGRHCGLGPHPLLKPLSNALRGPTRG